MKRVILHWTGGAHKPNATDRAAYHILINGTGQVHHGDHPISANERIGDGTPYAAHTRGCNTNSIGVALCAMHGAQERPWSAGRYPVTPEQVDALVATTARLCGEYGIPVTRETVLSHAEVERTLGIRQRAKIDIMWLPGMMTMGDPVVVGDRLRDLVRAKMQPVTPAAEPPPTPWSIEWVRKWFGS